MLNAIIRFSLHNRILVMTVAALLGKNGYQTAVIGKWKLELCPESGGWSAPRPGKDDTSALPPLQLYDLESDRAEKRNLQASHPDVVARLTSLLEKYVAEGRSTRGPRQKNTVTPRMRRP